MIKAFAAEFGFGFFGVLEANHFRGIHGSGLVKAQFMRHEILIAKMCRDTGRGIDRLD